MSGARPLRMRARTACCAAVAVGVDGAMLLPQHRRLGAPPPARGAAGPLNICSTSASEHSGTSYPWRVDTSSPSLARRDSASRTGVRDTPRASVMSSLLYGDWPAHLRQLEAVVPLF